MFILQAPMFLQVPNMEHFLPFSMLHHVRDGNESCQGYIIHDYLTQLHPLIHVILRKGEVGIFIFFNYFSSFYL